MEGEEKKGISIRIRFIHILVIFFIVSLVFNIFLVLKLDNVKANSKFNFIDPLAVKVGDSNQQEAKLVVHYFELKQRIESYMNQNSNKEDVGIFIQDIKTGAWMGINEKADFFPASLWKVPIAIAIFKKVESGKIKLTDSIEILSYDLDDKSGNLYKRGAGTKLTVMELVKEMLIFSDNTAKNSLKRNLSDREINDVFAHAGIPNPYIEKNIGVSPRGYIRFFKVLYFSTYLLPESSEQILALLSDSKNESSLTIGIPPEIKIAHKFGESPYGFHDCAIVYHPNNSYFICIMTKEMDLLSSQKLILTVSKETFNFVDKR